MASITLQTMKLLCFVLTQHRKDIVLPKTPAATRRRRPAAAKRSRTLRSMTRESVDSGVGLEMTKKSRVQLDSVTEKEDEEPTPTARKGRTPSAHKGQTSSADGVAPLTAASTDDEAQQNTEEKENVRPQRSSKLSRDVADGNEHKTDDQKNDKQSCSDKPSPDNAVTSEVYSLVTTFIIIVFRCSSLKIRYTDD